MESHASPSRRDRTAASSRIARDRLDGIDGLEGITGLEALVDVALILQCLSFDVSMVSNRCVIDLALSLRWFFADFVASLLCMGLPSINHRFVHDVSSNISRWKEMKLKSLVSIVSHDVSIKLQW